MDFQDGCEVSLARVSIQGAGTKLTKWLKRRDPEINRLDNLAKQHDIDYGKKSG